MSLQPGAQMQKYETIPTDRILIDLRGVRDALSIELRILEDGDVIDPGVLGTLQRNLGLVDRSIAGRTRANL
jgi:hypothetical protein